MTAVTICSGFGAQENKVCHCFHCFSIYPWARVKEKKNIRRKKELALPYHSGFIFPVQSAIFFVLPPAPPASLEKEKATHPSILVWEIPRTEEPGRLQSMGSQRVRHEWACMLAHTHTHTHITILSCSVTSPSLELFTVNTFPHLSCTLFSPLKRQYVSREWRGVFLAPRIMLGIWEARGNTVERRNSISKKRERKRTEAGRKWGPQK